MEFSPEIQNLIILQNLYQNPLRILRILFNLQEFYMYLLIIFLKVTVMLL